MKNTISGIDSVPLGRGYDAEQTHAERENIRGELRYGKALHEGKITGREHQGFVEAVHKNNEPGDVDPERLQFKSHEAKNPVEQRRAEREAAQARRESPSPVHQPEREDVKPMELGTKGGKLTSPMGLKQQKNFNQGAGTTHFGIPGEKWEKMTSEEQSAHKRSLGYEDGDPKEEGLFGISNKEWARREHPSGHVKLEPPVQPRKDSVPLGKCYQDDVPPAIMSGDPVISPTSTSQYSGMQEQLRTAPQSTPAEPIDGSGSQLGGGELIARQKGDAAHLSDLDAFARLGVPTPDAWSDMLGRRDFSGDVNSPAGNLPAEVTYAQIKHMGAGFNYNQNHNSDPYKK